MPIPVASDNFSTVPPIIFPTTSTPVLSISVIGVALASSLLCLSKSMARCCSIAKNSSTYFLSTLLKTLPVAVIILKVPSARCCTLFSSLISLLGSGNERRKSSRAWIAVSCKVCLRLGMKLGEEGFLRGLSNIAALASATDKSPLFLAAAILGVKLALAAATSSAMLPIITYLRVLFCFFLKKHSDV